MSQTILKKTLLTVSLLALSGCLSTSPRLGGGSDSGSAVSGGAGGASADNANSALERCDEPLGTVSIFEDTSLPWWAYYRSYAPNLGSTIPVIRLMVQQSGCFVVVERGRGMNAMTRERELMQSGELRGGSSFGKGQMVAADYTMQPSIQFSQKGTGGISGVLGGVLGSVGSAIAGGFKKNEAATTLLLVDNRSGVQISAAVGNASNYDFNLLGGLFGGGGLAGASGFTNTPEGKIITASFVDSFNQMVRALRNYKVQTVKGGLGKGGKLKVGE